MTNATAFWGSAGGNGSNAACYAAGTTNATTCDGDGNGRVISTGILNENYHVWRQLANAGLIEGQYTTDGSATTDPYSKRSKTAFWSISYAATNPIVGYYFNGEYGNMLLLSPRFPIGLSSSSIPSFVPEDVWNIDTKMDDGRPATGNLVVASTTGSLHLCTDVNPADPDAVKSATLTANYLLTSTTLTCGFVWRQQF